MRAALAIAWKELLLLRAYPLDLLNFAISPALLVAPYILVARLFGMSPDLVDSVAIGLILWYWLSILWGGVGMGLYEEMEEGVFETIFVSPNSFWALLTGRGLALIVLNVYITGSMIMWFLLFGVRLLLPWGWFWAVLLLAGLGLVGFALGLAGLRLLLKGAEVPYDIVQTGLGVLSGSTMPARLLPRPLWVVSRAIPLAYGIEAARRLLFGGRLEQGDLWLVALGALYAGIGWLALRAAEHRLRATGTTGEF